MRIKRSRAASVLPRSPVPVPVSIAASVALLAGLLGSCDPSGTAPTNSVTNGAARSTDPAVSSDGSALPTSESVAAPATSGPDGPAQVGVPGGAPPTGGAKGEGGDSRGDGDEGSRGGGGSGGGGVGGAPRGVLLIEAGGDWKPWLAKQNQECARAGAAPGCLKIEYASSLYDPRDPANYNCSVKVQTPANGQRRDNQTLVPVGTTVTVEATCERSAPESTSQSPESSTEAPATTDQPDSGHPEQPDRRHGHTRHGSSGDSDQ